MMKRLVLFIVLAVFLFLPLTSQAVITIFPNNEGFEGSWPPEGWTDNDFSRSRSHRKIATHSAKCTMGATYRDWIASDVVDCTGRYNIPFSLWYWVSSVDEDGPKMKIESSINGGRTWSLIDEFRITEEKTFVKYSTTITRFNNQDNCKIRIWVGYKRGATCYLDEVKFGGSGLTINAGSVKLTNATLDISGGVTITSEGTFSAHPGDVYLTGDWANEGTYSAYATSIVTLDGTNQTISGNSTFYNLTKSVPSACTLTFGSNDTQTISNTLTMTGSLGKVLTIRATAGGDQAFIEIPASIESGVDYVDVKDSHIDGEDYHTNPDAEIIIPGFNSEDSGNNTNWLFDTDPPTNVGCDDPDNYATDVALIPTLTSLLAEDLDAGLHDYPYCIQLDIVFTFDSGDLQDSGWIADADTDGWVPPITLNADDVYYWRVKARDTLENESSYCGHTANVEGYGTFTTTAAAVAQDLCINEVAFKETYDWIEIYVKTGGKNYGGCRIFDSGSERTTIPDSWGALTAGDYIVIHDESGTTDTVKGDNNSDYWDIYDTDIDLNHDDEIIEIKGPSGDDTRIDVVIWSDNSGDQFAGGHTHADAAVTANEWGGSANYSTTDTGAWTDSDYVFAAKSIGRDNGEPPTDDNSKNDWYLYTTIHTQGAQNGSLVINEVMYNSAGDDSGNEWIEIFNHSGNSIVLTDYDLGIYEEGDTSAYYTFPTFTLSANAYVVVHWRATGTNSATDLYTGTSAPFDDNMHNTVGYIGLWNSDSHASATFVDYIEYGAGDQSWESEANTAGIWDTGDSIALVPANKCIGRIPNGAPSGYDNNQPGDWTQTTNTTQGDVNEAVTEVIITITNWRELY